MIDFEVNSADYWESRFEGDWAQTQGCEQTRYFAGILLDNLPLWLEDEIQANSLSICDWGCAEGEGVDAFRTHFPRSRITGIDRSGNAIRRARDKFGTDFFISQDVLTTPLSATFDVISTSNVLQYFEAPWPVLQKLGVHAARHLLMLVPFREENCTPYTFDDATIGTRIDPDFILSSCKVIGPQILLVYSRSRYFPHPHGTFDMRTDEAGTSAGIPPAAGRMEALSRELGRATALFESREAELRKLATREAALHSDVQYWQTKAAALAKQLERQAAIETRLRTGQQEQAARFATVEKNYAAENQVLRSMANTSAVEAASLRRLVTELQSSLSWRMTAPLRFLAKPLFRARAPKTVTLHTPREPVRTAVDRAPREIAVTDGVSDPIPSPIETVILPELRRAQSIVVIQCAIPFSSALNQRPISFAKYFADRGATVLFVEVWQCPEQAIHQTGEEVYPRVFSIPFYAFQDNIVHTFQDNIDLIASASPAKRAYLCTLPVSYLEDVVRPLRASGYHIHYDIMDDWEEFHRGDEAQWYAASVERDILAIADTVTAVSGKLVQKFASLRPGIVEVRNGYQPAALACEQFIAARTPLMRPKVVGYFGHLSDAWFDWEAVFYAARKLPEVEFELIGYGLSEQSRVRLKDYPNIRFEGLVPQNNLHRYVRKWWAGMIPFRASAISAAVDPLKVYEYLHFGLGTVVTGIPGIAGYPMVCYAGNRESFVTALDKLGERPDEQSLSAAAEFLKTCTWEARLAKLDSLISQPAERVSPHAH